MLLSITMIVKNEAHILPQCIEALKPILNGIPSELIITDTGSTDGTIDIAKEHAHKFLEIEWNGDFAWARNHGLRAARGKWLMFIDADEIVEDASALIHFFKSGAYKKFGSAIVTMKNDFGNGNTDIYTMLRLTRLTKDIYFHKPIHESFNAKIQPTKELNLVLLHHGYSQATPEAKARMEAKHDRNIVPLLEYYKQNPDNKITMMQLISQYSIGKMFDEMFDLIDHALSVATDPNDIYYHLFHERLTHYCYRHYKYDKLLETLDKYFKGPQRYDVIIFNIKSLYADTLRELDRNNEAADVYKEILNLLDDHAKKPMSTESMEYTTLKEPIKYKDHCVKHAFLCYGLAGDFEQALPFYDGTASMARVANSILVNYGTVDHLLNYAFDNNFLYGNTNANVTDILSGMAYALLIKHQYDNATMVDLFYTYVLVRYEHLKVVMLNNPKAPRLAPQDHFVISVAGAFEKEGADVIGTLRQAVALYTPFRDVVQLVIDKIEADAVQE